jgi:hypothetical protein
MLWEILIMDGKTQGDKERNESRSYHQWPEVRKMVSQCITILLRLKGYEVGKVMEREGRIVVGVRKG